MLSDNQRIFARNVGIFIDHVYQSGYSMTLGEVWRSPEQAEIYAKEGKGIKDSLHCKRLALDFNLFSPQGCYVTDITDYAKFGEFWCKLNAKNRYGGNFHDSHGNPKPDSDHIEMQDI